MSKLFKLKMWLTVPDAARHLSIAFGEEVSESDVLRFCLDGHLKLSVQLVNGGYACRRKPVDLADIQFDRVSNLDGSGYIELPRNGSIRSDELGVFQVSREVTELEAAVWDLPLVAGERLDVEHRYQMLTGGPEVSTVYLDGALVQSTNGTLFELQEHFSDNKHFDKKNLKKPYLHADNFYPAGGLPQDSVLVVRTEALREFEQSLKDSPVSSARVSDNSLVSTIAALLGSWPGGKLPSGKDLERAAESIGISISDDSIRKALNAAIELAPSLKRPT